MYAFLSLATLRLPQAVRENLVVYSYHVTWYIIANMLLLDAAVRGGEAFCVRLDCPRPKRLVDYLIVALEVARASCGPAGGRWFQVIVGSACLPPSEARSIPLLDSDTGMAQSSSNLIQFLPFSAACSCLQHGGLQNRVASGDVGAVNAVVSYLRKMVSGG